MADAHRFERRLWHRPRSASSPAAPSPARSLARATHVDYTRDIIYQNTTSGDCSGITFTNANDEGYTDYIDGINWAVHRRGHQADLTPDGPVEPPTHRLQTPTALTADGGYVMVDSDLFGAEEAYAAGVGGELLVHHRRCCGFHRTPFRDR